MLTKLFALSLGVATVAVSLHALSEGLPETPASVDAVGDPYNVTPGLSAAANTSPTRHRTDRTEPPPTITAMPAIAADSTAAVIEATSTSLGIRPLASPPVPTATTIRPVTSSPEPAPSTDTPDRAPVTTPTTGQTTVATTAQATTQPTTPAAAQPAPKRPTTTTPTPTPTATTEATTTTTALPASAQYRLVWSDEFDSFNINNWVVEHSTYGDGNNELQCYSPDNVTVSNGMLHLTAKAETTHCPRSTRDYSSGMVRSRGKVDWLRGRFEVRARMPAGQGLWPAAWLSPTVTSYGNWPRSGEIDIVEALGHRTNRIIGSLHWYSPTGHRVNNKEFFANEGFTSQWHTYSLTWEEGLFIWAVDGVEYHRVNTWDSAVGSGDAPFDQPFYLKLNLAVGGRAPGSPDHTTPWPASYDIDYVRVYQLG